MRCESLRVADTSVDQRLPLFSRPIGVGEFDPLIDGGVRRLEDQEERIPINRDITGTSIPCEHHRRRVILMGQFKAKAVGFEFDMAGELRAVPNCRVPPPSYLSHQSATGQNLRCYCQNQVVRLPCFYEICSPYLAISPRGNFATRSIMSNSTAPSTTRTSMPSEHPAQNPDLSSILQCHLTPSVLHALSVLYPKAFRPN